MGLHEVSASSSFLRLILSLRPSASRLAAAILACICSPDISAILEWTAFHADAEWEGRRLRYGLLIVSGVGAGLAKWQWEYPLGAVARMRPYRMCRRRQWALKRVEGWRNAAQRWERRLSRSYGRQWTGGGGDDRERRLWGITTKVGGWPSVQAKPKSC